MISDWFNENFDGYHSKTDKPLGLIKWYSEKKNLIH